MQVIFLNNLLRTLSWTFIHSLWQGLMLTIAAGLIMLITKRSAASLRYALVCTLFFLFLGGVVVTFLTEWYAGEGNSSGLKFMSSPAGIDTIFHHSIFEQPIKKLGLFLDSNSLWIVSGWLIILSFKSARMILDMMYVSRLRNHKLSAPGDEWKIKLQSLSYEIGIRKKVSLLQSALVKIPIVVGHLKPVILIPIGTLTGLPATEVEAVLIHELAHIRRHDYLVNCIQRIAEMLFFFNPALLWVSSLLRIERENCCDDIAIAKTKDKLQFVEALISFKEHSLRHPRYALGLFGKRNLLLQRVTRIVHNKNKTLSPFEVVFFMINVIILVLLISVTSKPEVMGQSTPPPLASYVEPLSFSSEPTREIQPVSKKKSVSVSKQALSSSSDRIDKLTVKIKDHLSPEQTLDEQKKLTEEDRQLTQLDNHHVQLSRLQAEIDRAHAEKNRRQADEDRKRADKDREQAEKDRQQAEIDRMQANKDREQAELDRKRAEKDRERAEKAGPGP